MLLLVIFALVQRLIDAGSGSSDEDYGNAIATGFNRIGSTQELASSESARCHICGLRFRNLGIHMAVHNHQKPFECSQCGKQFTRANSLKSHQQMHSGKKLHDCPICDKQFTRPETLRKHQQMHDDVKSFQCTECDKQFAYAHRLHTHQRTHTGEKPFICLDCGKQFARADNLQIHQRVHTTAKSFRCTKCDKQFASVRGLSAHQRFHTVEKPFICPQCGSSFTSVSNFRAHQRLHTEKKPFRSTGCKKQSTPSNNLLQHNRTHIIVKFSKCCHCGKYFTKSCNMRRHLRSHTDGKTFECLKCKKLFARAEYLRNHHQRKHAFLENSTGSPSNSSLGQKEVSIFSLENPLLLQTLLRHSVDGSQPIKSQNLTTFNNASLIQSDLENFDDIPSSAQPKDCIEMENPFFPDTSPEILLDDTSLTMMDDPSVMGNQFLFQSVFDNPVLDSSLTQMDNTSELENSFLMHLLNPVGNLTFPEVPMESISFGQPQSPTTLDDRYLIQKPVDNLSLANTTEEDTVLQKLIDKPSLARASTHDVSKTPLDSALFVPMQEHIFMNTEDSMPDVRLPSDDSDAVSDSTHLECPICLDRFSERSSLEGHMLSSSCSLFPLNWLPYVENDDNSDLAK